MSLLGASIGVNALGSVFGALGARDREKATRRAVKRNRAVLDRFTKEFLGETQKLTDTKQGILSNSENVFDRLGGFIFGNTDSLSNLRKAQEDFSDLAAGDFSSFGQETQAIVSSALANTFGRPTGSFENLSARNLFDFRSEGLRNAMTLNTNFAQLGSGLIDTEFGILDRDFDQRLALKQNEANTIMNLNMAKAGVAGSTQAGIGSVLNTVGQGLSSFANFRNLQNNQLNLDSFSRTLSALNSGGNVASGASNVVSGGGGGFSSFSSLPQGGGGGVEIQPAGPLPDQFGNFESSAPVQQPAQQVDNSHLLPLGVNMTAPAGTNPFLQYVTQPSGNTGAVQWVSNNTYSTMLPPIQ